jgi:hypothetical protein
MSGNDVPVAGSPFQRQLFLGFTLRLLQHSSVELRPDKEQLIEIPSQTQHNPLCLAV